MNSLPLERFEFATATALIEPEPEVPDTMAEELAAIEEAQRVAAENAARQEALIRELQALAAAAAGSKLSAIGMLGEAIGSTIAKLLPSIAKSNFATEVADCTVMMLRETDIAKAELLVNPADEALLVEALQNRSIGTPIEVVAAPEVPVSRAQLSWVAGGAVFDADAWVKQVQSILDIHQPSLSQQEPTND